MLLILLSWIYIFFISVNFGVITCQVLRLSDQGIIVKSMLGLFAIAIAATAWAIFGRIGIEFQVALLISNIIIFVKWRREITADYLSFANQVRNLPRSVRILMTAISILIIAQCAAAPYIVDNESYYIQTIKWLNEFGLIPGLANLHIFFGQTSAWHLAQSALNFSFIYSNFNDLSGFCLLLGNIFALLRLGAYFRTNNKTDLIIGIFPIVNVLLFQFIGAPSPDIPIYVLTLIVVATLLKEDEMPRQQFVLISILALFAVFIKSTSMALFVIPFLLFVRNYRALTPALHIIAIISGIVLALFAVKNCIVSGYVLFPTLIGQKWFAADSQVPEQIASFYYNETKYFAFKLTELQYQNMSAFQLFKHWITMPRLHGIFNMISMILLVTGPFLIKRFFNDYRFWMLYAAMTAQLLLLAVSSPQYRFFLNFVIIFGLIWIAAFFTNRRVLLAMLYGGCVICFTLLLVPVNYGAVTKNRLAKSNSLFQTRNVIFPHANSKSETVFEIIETGNLRYNSPVENDFLFGTGDGPLPCVNKEQLRYFEAKFGFRPRMRTDELADGFLSEKTQ